MGKSKVGSILTLIAGIVTILFAALILMFSFILLFVPTIMLNMVRFSRFTLLAPTAMFLIVFIIALIGIVIGCLQIYASRLMNHSKTCLRGGVIALVIGILTAWNMISILSIVGGILGIVQGSD